MTRLAPIAELLTAESHLESPTTAAGNKSSSKQNDPGSSRRLLRKLSSKFLESTGEGGADVTALREINRPDFEGYALISRRANKKRSSLGSLLRQKQNHAPKERFLVIKGAFCFVFKDELSPAAKYAIRLAYTNARIVPSFQEKTTVVLETASEGDLEFEFLLSEYANNFVAVANQIALQGETEGIQQRLGNVNHLSRRSSLRYAKKIAMETPSIPNLAGQMLPKRNCSSSHAA